MATSQTSPTDKAREYLVKGKIKVVYVDHETARLTAQGSHPIPYEIRCENGVWRCTCPAHILDCAHVIAGKLIIGHLEPAHPIQSTNHDLDELTQMLDSLGDPEPQDWA